MRVQAHPATIRTGVPAARPELWACAMRLCTVSQVLGQGEQRSSPGQAVSACTGLAEIVLTCGHCLFKVISMRNKAFNLLT